MAPRLPRQVSCAQVNLHAPIPDGAAPAPTLLHDSNARLGKPQHDCNLLAALPAQGLARWRTATADGVGQTDFRRTRQPLATANPLPGNRGPGHVAGSKRGAKGGVPESGAGPGLVGSDVGALSRESTPLPLILQLEVGGYY